MLRYVNDGVTIINPGHQTTGNARDVRWVVLHAVPSMRKSLRLENTQASLQSGMPGSVPIAKHGGGFVVVWAPISWYSILLSHHYPWWPITAEEYVDRLSNQVHHMIQTLFPNNDAVPPFTQLELFSNGLKCMKVNFSNFPDQHNRQIWTILNHSGQFWRLKWITDSHLQLL
jgi:hypothetical protein